MQRNKIKSFLDQLEDKYKSPNTTVNTSQVFKSKQGFLEVKKLGKKSLKPSDVRSRSRDTKGKQRTKKGKDTSKGMRKPAKIGKQRKLNLADYLPLTEKLLEMKGRWMAMEDLNIYLYVRDFGVGFHKRQEFWDQGYENFLWRKSKTVSSLRNRERWYVCHLRNKDIGQIRKHVRQNPDTPCYNNFTSLGNDIKKLTSISNDRPYDTLNATNVARSIPVCKTRNYNAQDRLAFLISKRQPRYPEYSTSQWFRISKSYWEDWVRSKPDQRNWIQLNEALQSEELWSQHAERLSITLGDGKRKVTKAQFRPVPQLNRYNERFLHDLGKQYGVSTKQIKKYFSNLSETRSDIIEFLDSDGQKLNLLWQPEEDDVLRKHYRNPNQHLMQLIMKLKGPERIERRLKFLKVI